MPKPEKFNSWQDEYEWHAASTTRSLSRLSEQQLLERIRNRQFDPYFAVWQALRKKGTLRNSAPVCLEVLREESGQQAMLQRYHCTGALFALMGEKENPLDDLRKRVQWDHEGEDARQAAINILEAAILEILAKDSFS